MNRDTPDLVNADDFPFLGPAISPRRHEPASALGAAGELAAPFVAAATPVEADRPQVVSEEDREEVLEDLPAADWPSDDFPWLLPAEPESSVADALPAWGEAADRESTEPAAAEDLADEPRLIDELGWAQETEVLPGLSDESYASTGFQWAEDISAAAADAQEVAGGFGWEGTASSDEEDDMREAPPVVWGDQPSADTERAAETFQSAGRWDGGVIDLGEAEEDVEDEGAAEAGRGAEEAGWTESAVIDGATAEPAGAGGDSAFSDADEEAAGVRYPTGESEASSSPFDRGYAEEPREPSRWEWQEPVSSSRDDEGADRWDSGPEELLIEEEAAVEPEPAVSTDAGASPLTAAALPVGEWEDSAATVEVEEEVPHAAEVAPTAGPLEDVAERLERIARSLRSGNPVEAFDQGDPLQLLITGYALGYSEARKGRG